MAYLLTGTSKDCGTFSHDVVMLMEVAREKLQCKKWFDQNLKNKNLNEGDLCLMYVVRNTKKVEISRCGNLSSSGNHATRISQDSNARWKNTLVVVS